jgi:hypothetical protein
MMRSAEEARLASIGVERTNRKIGRSKGKGQGVAKTEAADANTTTQKNVDAVAEDVAFCPSSPMKAKSEGQAKPMSPGAKRIKIFRERKGNDAKHSSHRRQLQ